MLELRDVTVRYAAGGPAVLRGVDLDLQPGELVLVAGRTGSGKSTLLGVLNGLVPTFTGGELRGDVLLDGVSILEQPPREQAHAIGFVGQDPGAGFVADTVEEELAYGMEQLGLPPATMRRRVEETLDLLGVADLRRRDLATLSGGQQQRVAIGAVLTMHPRVLVLDEPTSALDPTAAEDVLATLTRLATDLDVCVVLAEHRLERVVPHVDRIALVGGDGTVTAGWPADVLATSPVAPPLVELGRWAGWSPLPLDVRSARRAARGLVTRLALPEAPVLAPAPAPHDGGVTARRVSVAYGRRPALREVDLDVAPGEVVALMGRNGAGKSTLLWALQGSRARQGGSVDVAGDDPARLPVEQRRRRVAMVPQTAADLLYLETVAQECAAADRDADVAPGSAAALLEELVPDVDPDAHPRDLSEGQRLALVLALVLVATPAALLLDEPTRGLDYPGKRALREVLRRQAAAGRAVLVATHDVEFVAQVADRVVVLAQGEVVSAGPTDRVVAESPAFAPQVHKVLGSPWLTVDQVRGAAS